MAGLFAPKTKKAVAHAREMSVAVGMPQPWAYVVMEYSSLRRPRAAKICNRTR